MKEQFAEMAKNIKDQVLAETYLKAVPGFKRLIELNAESKRILDNFEKASGLSRNEIISRVQTIPYSLSDVYRFYLSHGKWPNE